MQRLHTGSQRSVCFMRFSQFSFGNRMMSMATAEDTMNDGVQFFEGVEKLLEIWFTSSDNNNKARDLRKIPRFV